MTLTKIRKRDGRLAEFNEEKIARAIEKAFNATYKPGRGEEARKLAMCRPPSPTSSTGRSAAAPGR